MKFLNVLKTVLQVVMILLPVLESLLRKDDISLSKSDKESILIALAKMDDAYDSIEQLSK